MKFPLRKSVNFVALALAGVLLFMCTERVSGQSDHSKESPGSAVYPTKGKDRIASLTVAEEAREGSPFANVPLHSVGPTIMSGRVVDIAVSPDDPTVFYVAYATGGLWRTASNGSSFTPVSDRLPSAGIGDFAVRWGDPDVLYVGTGESNASTSVIAGAGLYRSSSKGEDWEYMGLAETHNIGRVLLSPADTNVIFVAAVGHLYSHNAERGVFKSVDGGKTWQHSLQIDDSTGVVDLMMHPNNPDVLYAAAWHRSRTPWNFVEGGRTSGVYRTVDGGETWKRLSTKKSGFPTGRTVGRIGLAIAPAHSSTLYAVVDNQTRVEKVGGAPALTFETLADMDCATFVEKVPADDVTEFLVHYGFPEEIDAKRVRALIRRGEATPRDLVRWVGETNRLHYDSEVIGCEVYRSNDGGEHWWRTHEKPLVDVCESYGYYFGKINVDPADPDRIYVSGIPLLRSNDGGETFENIGRENVHVDHHALWINPDRPNHLISGNDGGVNISYDMGETWFKLNSLPVGQLYTVTVDAADPYNIYGGLQDNGVWFGPSTYEYSTSWLAEGAYPYERLLGGDGTMTQIPWTDTNVVYVGKQFGEYYRITKHPREVTSIRPYHQLGEEPLRFNFLAPIRLSIHNDRILYLGSQKVHRSMDSGATWESISGDLTLGDPEGDVPYGTLTALVESPLKFGVLYAGSDDGLIHVTKNGGVNWELVSGDLPPNMWVSGIEPSSHRIGRVYAILSAAHRDNYEPMVYASEDFGHSWRKIATSLPLVPVNVVREDPVNEDILYLGTDRDLYVSIDRGDHFMPAGGELPVVPIKDLAIQPNARELAIATHGRSIYTMDIDAIEQMTPDIVSSSIHAFELDTVWFDREWGSSDPAWAGANLPQVEFTFWSKTSGMVNISIFSEGGIELVNFERVAKYGLNYVQDDLCMCEGAIEEFVRELKHSGEPYDEENLAERDNGRYYLPPGSYKVQFDVKGHVAHTRLVVSE